MLTITIPRYLGNLLFVIYTVCTILNVVLIYKPTYCIKILILCEVTASAVPKTPLRHC